MSFDCRVKLLYIFCSQVFHICEAGKKISFLCPNGTIFQQTDLICDWWFKVNCAASPGHYAESSEVLSRAQKRPQLVPEESFSSENFSESRESGEERVRSGKDSVRRNQQKKLKSRNEETFDSVNVSGENFDFEDISTDLRKSNGRSRQTNRNRISNRNAKRVSDDFLESQEVAETASFVVDRQSQSRSNFNGYHYEPPKAALEFKTQPQDLNATKNETSANQSLSGNATSNNSTFTGYVYNKPDRNSRRLETVNVQQESANATTTATRASNSSSTTSRRGSINYQNQATASRQERKQDSSPTPNSLLPEVKSTVASVVSRHPSTYTTARRLETSRTTPFYTPTVPSIPSLIYRAPTVQTNTELQTAVPTTTSIPSVSEHAMEMIRTIHELRLNSPIPTAESERPPRPGLIVPPSSGPDTLHSLALYFATAVDNMMTNPENQTTTTNVPVGALDNLDVQIGNVTKITAAHVRNVTIEKYEKLFGIDKQESLGRSQLSSRMDNNEDTKFTSPDNDLETEYSNNPILAAAGSPQIRELAKVFTHALSAYLHDPATFRRVLSEIRPTEPSLTANGNEILSNRIGRTEDFNKGTGPTYLPTVATTSATATTTYASTTEDFEVLDFSDVTLSTMKKELNFPSTTPSATNPTTTDFPSTTTPSTTTSADGEESSTVLSNIIQESLNSADRVPASRFLTEQLLLQSSDREPKRLETTTTTDANNPFALEINGGLIMSTSFPYFQDDSKESSRQSLEDSSYFPAQGTIESRSQLKPYGHDVNRNNSLINDTYPTALSDTQAVPLKWGEEITEDYSTPTTTEFPASLSFELLPPSAVQKGFSLPSAKEQVIDDNDLQRAQSQSLVASGNELLNDQKGKAFTATASPRFGDRTTTTDYPTVTTTINGHFITHDYRTSTESSVHQAKTTIPDSGKFSPNPWSTLAYTVFLDPLTINDGLMDAKLKDATPSANTYLPRSTQTTPYSPSTTTALPPSTYLPEALFNRNGDSDDSAREGKYLGSTSFPTTLRDKQPEEYMEVMQKKANEMFGNLNDTSATHLLNVMKKANKNRTVRKLILLLIQTCDDDYNTTVEESRKALLDALIGMDGKIDDENDVQVINARSNRRGKNIARFEGNSVTAATSTETPITTFRRPLFTLSTSAPQYLYESTTNSDALRTTTVTTTNPSFEELSTTTSVNRANEGYGIYFRTDGEYSTTSDDHYSHEPTEQTTFTEFDETTTLSPTTTTTTTTHSPITTNKPVSNRTRSSQSRRIAKDLDDLLGQSSQAIEPNGGRVNKHSDTRALDLLRSLYSLAGRFGR